jgi:hypothetical protein
MSGDDRGDPADVIPTHLPEDKPALIERRRSGRVRYTNKALIALLRRTGGDDVSEEDKGSPTRGIIVGLGISALLWSVIGMAVWLVLRRR